MESTENSPLHRDAGPKTRKRHPRSTVLQWSHVGERGWIWRGHLSTKCIPCVRFVPRPLRFVKGTLLGEEDRWLGVGDADSALV